jgi:hypothetical protein
LSYIGRTPIVGNFVKLDAITTSATTTFNLTNGGVAYYPQSANNCIVSLNGVIQSPTSAYTISGSTIVFSDALTSSDTIDFILVLGDVLSIGTPSDGTVTSAKLASGVSGLISWQSVQTTGFTAVAGRGYPCNTTSAAFTVTLPASPSAGDEIIILDYAGTFDTNALTINPNGGKIEGGTSNLQLTGEREGATLTYIDSTQGWLANSGINEGTDALSPISYSVDFLVVAGGGGAGSAFLGGGGGAGGYRTSTQTVNQGTVITVTVGDGGAGGVNSVPSAGLQGTTGSDSSISGSGLTTITSAGGGGGSTFSTAGGNGKNGGSGGGSSYSGTMPNAGTAGTGNTPSTSPSQGNNGGTGFGAGGNEGAGGGGGASAVGANGTTTNGGNGGDGTASSITGSSVTRAGGGGGSTNGGTPGSGGSGGGGNASNGAGSAGTANTGGGGGGSDRSPGSNGGAGGKGVVILSMATAKYTGTTTGSPTVTTKNAGADTVLQFNGSGSYTA